MLLNVMLVVELLMLGFYCDGGCCFLYLLISHSSFNSLLKKICVYYVPLKSFQDIHCIAIAIEFIFDKSYTMLSVYILNKQD